MIYTSETANSLRPLGLEGAIYNVGFHKARAESFTDQANLFKKALSNRKVSFLVYEEQESFVKLTRSIEIVLNQHDFAAAYEINSSCLMSMWLIGGKTVVGIFDDESGALNTCLHDTIIRDDPFNVPVAKYDLENFEPEMLEHYSELSSILKFIDFGPSFECFIDFPYPIIPKRVHDYMKTSCMNCQVVRNKHSRYGGLVNIKPEMFKELLLFTSEYIEKRHLNDAFEALDFINAVREIYNSDRFILENNRNQAQEYGLDALANEYSFGKSLLLMRKLDSKYSALEELIFSVEETVIDIRTNQDYKNLHIELEELLKELSNIDAYQAMAIGVYLATEHDVAQNTFGEHKICVSNFINYIDADMKPVLGLIGQNTTFIEALHIIKDLETSKKLGDMCDNIPVVTYSF